MKAKTKYDMLVQSAWKLFQFLWKQARNKKTAIKKNERTKKQTKTKLKQKKKWQTN